VLKFAERVSCKECSEPHTPRRQTKGEKFVLIHGTWHGGWAWDAVIRELSGNGHRGHAPTLAGHGPAVARLRRAG